MASGSAAASVGHWERFRIDGRAREALVFRPTVAKASLHPMLFVFHGHAARAGWTARDLELERLWPEAIVVYLQGIPGHRSAITDPQGRGVGWQTEPGELGDRDLAFFDAVFDRMVARERGDPARSYLFGHSNGGRFALLLWAMRPGRVAALCSVAPAPGTWHEPPVARSLFLAVGENDPLIPLADQQPTIEAARRRIGSDPARATTAGFLASEPAPEGLELALYRHPGRHLVPKESLPAVVEFFRRHRLEG